MNFDDLLGWGLLLLGIALILSGVSGLVGLFLSFN